MYQVMNSGISSKNVPGFKTSPESALFFAIFVISAAFFIINLFISVVVSSYNREIERSGQNFLLTSGQKKLIETKMATAKLSPSLGYVRPNSRFRQWFFDITTNRYFEVFIATTITISTIFMCIKWPGMT
jgi:hypothetical protein